jgi:protein-disulfide isomerase
MFGGFRAVLAISGAAMLCTSAGAQTKGNAAPADEAVVQRLKTEIIRELQTGDWLSEQVERGIDRYVQRTKAAQDAAAAEQARLAEERAKAVRPVDPRRDYILGNPNADVSLIEFSDFECPYCRQFHKSIGQVLASYDGRVNLVFRHYPLTIHDPAAHVQAKIAICAAMLGGNRSFWKFADLAFARPATDPERRVALPSGKAIGVPTKNLAHCVESDRAEARIRQDMAEGEKLGITGTPTTVATNNRTGHRKLLVGIPAMADLKTKISDLLSESNAAMKN